jgi:hypothetical protein
MLEVLINDAIENCPTGWRALNLCCRARVLPMTPTRFCAAQTSVVSQFPITLIGSCTEIVIKLCLGAIAHERIAARNHQQTVENS